MDYSNNNDTNKIRQIAGTVAYKRPMRIALLGYRSHPHVGGQGIYIKYLSEALARLGHHVDVLSGPPYPELDTSVNLIQIPSLNLFESPNHIKALRWRHLRSFSDTYEWWTMATGGFAEPYTFGRRVKRYLTRLRQPYDVIHDNQSLSYALLSMQNLGMPIVSTVHHPITRDLELALESATSSGHAALIKRWYSFLGMQTKVIRRLDHVVSVSQQSKIDIAHAFGRPQDSIQVISNGVDTKLFRPLAHLLREPLRLLCTASSDQPLKGVDVCFKALSIVKQQLPPEQRSQLTLVLIGTLKANGSNEKLMHALGLGPNVVCKSGLSNTELVEEYARASLAICPSRYEGFGLPAAEALCCGTPLISSDGGALSEVVADAGQLVAAGNEQALAQAILNLLRNPEQAHQLSERSIQLARPRFCWDRVALDWQEYYIRHLVPTFCEL